MPVTQPLKFLITSMLVALLTGCATGSVSGDRSTARTPSMFSSPWVVSLPDGFSLAGSKYANGAIEVTLSTADFRFTSGSWQLPIEAGNATRGELEILLPDGVIKTMAGLKNFTPQAVDRFQMFELPNAQVAVLDREQMTMRMPGSSRTFKDVTLISASGAKMPLTSSLGSWLELARDMRAISHNPVKHFAGVVANEDYKVGMYRYTGGKMVGSHSISYREHVTWGLVSAGDRGLWALGGGAKTYRLDPEKPVDTSQPILSGLTSIGLKDGAVLRGRIMDDGQLDGPVTILKPGNDNLLYGRYTKGEPQGAFQERNAKGDLLALEVPTDDGQRLRIAVDASYVPCGIGGLPKAVATVAIANGQAAVAAQIAIQEAAAKRALEMAERRARGEVIQVGVEESLPEPANWLVPPANCVAGQVQGEMPVALRRDHAYALLNIAAENGVVQKGALAALSSEGEQYVDGGFWQGNFSGSLWKGDQQIARNQPVSERLIFQGTFKQGLADGEGICGYKIELEYCAYQRGVRVDALYQARVLAAAEAKRQSECRMDYESLPYAHTYMVSNFNANICQSRWDYLKRHTSIAIDEGGEAFSPNRGGIDSQIYAVEECYDENFTRKARSASDDFEKLVNRLSANQCYDSGVVNAERSLVSQNSNLLTQIANEGKSALAPYYKIQRQGKAAWSRLEAQREQQLRQDIINNVRETLGSVNTEMAAIQRNTNQQMALVNNHNAMVRTRQQAQANVYRPATPVIQASTQYTQKEKLLEQDMHTVCGRIGGRKAVQRNGEWHCEAENKVVMVPWNPTRLCYDPSGKTCNTGAPYGQVAGSGAGTSSLNGSAGGGVGAGGGSIAGGSGSAATTGSSSASSTKDDGKTYEHRWESVGYCWQTANKRWLCHGPYSKKVVSEVNLADAEKDVCDYRSRQPQKDGYIYFCNHVLESYQSDIMEIYKLYGAAASRKQYNCPVGGMTVQCKQLN